MEKIWFVICFSVFIRVVSSAQEPSVSEIAPIVVESNKKFFSDDQTTLTINSEIGTPGQLENLGYLLSRKSPLVIRNYGSYGSLTSVSMHGTGSNHTQVSWNGIPLNSPTTGQADLSLLPAGFVQSVEVINGASGSLFGSGTFGGSINLDNRPDWNNRITARYSFNYGSFDHFGHLLMLKAGTTKFQYHLSLVKSSAENDYLYRDMYQFGTPVRRNSNNKYNDAGILQNVYVNAGKGNFFEAGMWYQKKDLGIPSIMGSYESVNARQKDSLFRAYVSYRKKGEKSAIFVRSAYLSDFLSYVSGSPDNPLAYIDSKIYAGRMINETDFRYFIASGLIAGGGFSHNLIAGKSENYKGSITENEFAVFGNLKYILNDLIINAGVRKEFYRGITPAPQFSMGIRYLALNSLALRASFSTKFRKPSLNEKYWRPGGNPNLRPEKGYGGEFTAEWIIDSDKDDETGISVKLMTYYQIIDNWIQWVMKDSLTPVEYKTVHARGIESWLDYSLKVYPFVISGYINYNYNRSTITATYDDNPLYKGNQVIYIPRNSVRASTSVKYSDLKLDVTGTFAGVRETVESGDAYLQLPSYMLIDAGLTFRRDVGSNLSVGLWGRCDNIFNKRYEIIRAYPVPGRTFHIGITVGFEKTGTNNHSN